MNILFKRSTFLIGVSIGMTATAQTNPDAGSLLQQLQPKPSNSSVPNDFVRPKIAPPPEEMQDKSGISIAVRQIRFVGNSLIKESVLSDVVKPWLGKTLDFNELKRATQAVAQVYRDAGWVVRAYLPKQDVTEGVIAIQIVEGRFGKTQIDGALPARLKLSTALGMIGTEQAHGEPLNAEKIGRGVLLISELPGVSATASLKAGEQDGETDIVLKLDEGKLVTGYISVDNSGARSTGVNHLTTYIAVNDPLGIGDQAQTVLLYSKGTKYGQLAYSLPVGSRGLRLGANASKLDYSLVGDQFSSLDAKGQSTSFGLNLRYPIILSGQSKLYAGVMADRKGFNNEANQVVVSKYDISDLVFSLSGNHYDYFNGGGLTESTLLLTRGRLNLNGSPNQEVDSLTAQTQGSYSKLQYSLSRYQTLDETLNLYATLSGQFASKNLDSAEKFYLGGANGVRAYPVNEGGGSAGQMANIELRKRLTRDLLLRGFYDWGRIKVNQNSDYFGAAVQNQYALKGLGLGLDWTAKNNVNVRAQWAYRIGANPNPTINGNDQDGSLVKNRFWLNVTIPFGFDMLGSSRPAQDSGALAVTPTFTTPNLPAAGTGAQLSMAPVSSPDVVARSSIGTEVITAPTVVASTPLDLSPISELSAILDQWRNAWANADVNAYLGFYASDFRPANGLTITQWRVQRQQRLGNAGKIQIDLSAPQIAIDGDTAQIHFAQTYRSSRYADTVSKTLILKRQGKDWKIVSEVQSPLR